MLYNFNCQQLFYIFLILTIYTVCAIISVALIKEFLCFGYPLAIPSLGDFFILTNHQNYCYSNTRSDKLFFLTP